MKNGLTIDMFFKMYMQIIIRQIMLIQKIAKKQNKLNEQYFLDFQDKLNELSIDPEP